MPYLAQTGLKEYQKSKGFKDIFVLAQEIEDKTGLADVINPPLWQIVHSLGLTDPYETNRNVKGEYVFSLWAVRQTSMGFALGGGQRETARPARL